MIPPSGIVGLVYAGIKSNPFTLVFWAIAVYEAYKILKPREGITPKVGIIQEASNKGTTVLMKPSLKGLALAVLLGIAGLAALVVIVLVFVSLL